MKAITILGTLAFMTLSAGCKNTADGVKKDAETAAAKTADAAAATGAAVSGAAETGQIKTALVADTRIDASDINVDTDEAKKTVTLKGTVPTEANKTIAGEIATSKATGYTVINELTIKPKK